MTRPLLALWAVALPVAAAAQGYGLRPATSVGEAMHLIDRLEQRRDRNRDAGIEPGRADDDGPLRQTFILPERPGQNLVAWYPFRWHEYDATAPGGGGGIRLFFYESERAQAQRALPAIQSAYARLVELFHYVPTKRIPYILYGTQREFQTTNVFEVSESVLGVTSPQDLKMTVPYFGDHARFIEVSTHEMVHQFTIQKLLEAAGSDDMSSPINYLPLWYIEGIAEYYSKGGIDVETDLFLRDLVFNPDPSKHYEILSFGEDRLRGYIPTYKLGQARLAFIADVYGPEKIQGFLESAYLLGESGGSAGGGGSTRNFGGLVRRVLNEPIEQVDQRWHAWLKNRYYPAYLAARQDLAQVRELRNLPGEPESFTASPDGSLLLVRGIDREHGRARLYLVDPRSPRSAVTIAGDDQPGLESLHPIEYAIGALAAGVLAFSAQDGPGDSLFVQQYRHTAPEGKPPRLEVGKRHKLDVVAPDGSHFVQIAYPAFSTDASHIAFVGVASDGQQDIYVVPVRGGQARRVTNDFYAEKDLTWGVDGIYCASDATDHGLLNLFRVDPGTGERTRLTTTASNDRHPRPQADGSVLYASDVRGKPDLWLLKDGKTRRLTDFTTGLNSPFASPKGRGIYAGTFHGGLFRLVDVPKATWLDEPAVDVPPAAGDVLEIPVAAIPPRPPAYNAFDIGRNWRPEAGIVYGGGAANAIAGRAAVLFDDTLRDHSLFVDLAVYGSFDYTQALALYENRTRRVPWALGAFHYVQQQIDSVDPNLVYYQRDFGVVGAVRYPLDRFRRLEFELTLGAVQRYCLTDFNPNSTTINLACSGIQTPGSPYADPQFDPNGPPAEQQANVESAQRNWVTQNGGVNPQISPTIRFGYDTLRYDPYTGPIDGSSLLLEFGGGYLPTRKAVHGFARLDAERYWQLIGRSNFMLRFAGGTAFSPGSNTVVWERTYWLTSADNLRGFYPFDIVDLIGHHFYVANAELQFPMDALIRLLFFDYIEGVMAMDFGGVFNQLESTHNPDHSIARLGAWDARTLTGVLGVNVLFGPLLLRVHFGHPFDVGGFRTPALAAHDRWVTNVTLRYFFF
ncbi:MAG TPA: hypothetical protein VLU43_07825 [Anaeromyxobacteraceae bacterium]|nr:hypothetical protein [Anaeromyxobacteraceae bacterium]